MLSGAVDIQQPRLEPIAQRARPHVTDIGSRSRRSWTWRAISFFFCCIVIFSRKREVARESETQQAFQRHQNGRGRRSSLGSAAA